MIRTITIDDEPLALQLVNSYVEKTPGVELIGSFENPMEAMDFIQNNAVDIIFMDIQMPDLNGLELTRILNNRHKIIFTTAFEKYAIEGYKLDVVDYLLKPFNYEEFVKAIEKAKKLIGYENLENDKIESNTEFLFLKSEYKLRRINFNDIIYIEGLKDYVKVFTQHDSKPILSLNSLKTLEAKLPDSKFMRIHRSFIVNLNKIETIDRSRIVFGNTYIPVGQQYKDAFQEYLNNHFL